MRKDRKSSPGYLAWWALQWLKLSVASVTGHIRVCCVVRTSRVGHATPKSNTMSENLELPAKSIQPRELGRVPEEVLAGLSEPTKEAILRLIKHEREDPDLSVPQPFESCPDGTYN